MSNSHACGVLRQPAPSYFPVLNLLGLQRGVFNDGSKAGRSLESSHESGDLSKTGRLEQFILITRQQVIAH